MDLQHPIAKAISVVALMGVTLEESADEATANAAGASVPQSTASATTSAVDPGTPPAAPAEPSACASGMILVEGDYCPDVEQVCLRWLDPPPYQNLRCAEYAKPAKCKSARVHKRFCIDREEYADGSAKNEAGETLPVVHMSWLEAKAICETRGARLCKESEWELACEGPEMSPYPYGWKRDSAICNLDRTDLGGPEEKLTDHRAPLGAFPRCLSPYGVHDMVGNVDEFTERENVAAPNRNALHGGWWLPGRNRCRAATIGHPESYGGKQVGFRCCKEATR